MDLIDILLANKLIEKKLPPTILNLRGSVATTSQLPLTNNHKGDVWVVQSSNAEYVWMSDNASGTLSDYEDFGPVIDLSPYRTAADQDVIDSGKQSKVTASGILKGDGNGGVSAAVAGTDYSNIMPGDPYPGVDLTQKFAAEIAEAGNPWAWIDGRIQTENFEGIHVGDYIPFTTDNGYTFRALIMGIDTYKGMSYSNGSITIPSHIDFRFHTYWPFMHSINPVNWNNGLIPVESIVTDGESGQFVLTKEMNQVATVKEGTTEITGWSYDPETYTLTFATRPPAGHTYTVTGVGSEHPWTSCDGFLWLNSLVGQVPNSIDAPPNTAVKHVDYTNGGVYSHLPEALKNVIVEKVTYNETRISASSNLGSSNGCAIGSIGKLWLCSEVEMAGRNVFTALGVSTCYDAQYPLFMQNRMLLAQYQFILNAETNANTGWCCVFPGGGFRFALCSQNLAFVPCFRIAKRST